MGFFCIFPSLLTEQRKSVSCTLPVRQLVFNKNKPKHQNSITPCTVTFLFWFGFFLATTSESLMVFHWHSCHYSKVSLKSENPRSRSGFNNLSIKPRPYISSVTSEILRQQENRCLIWHSCRLIRSCLISEETSLLTSTQVN